MSVDRALFRPLYFLEVRARILLKVATKILLELNKSWEFSIF